jgi:hypothetical protein
MKVSEEQKRNAPIARSRSNDIEGMRALPKRRATIDEFLKSELALCLTFLFVAAVKYEVGKEESAEESLANAEEVYSGVLLLVSDTRYSKHLGNETIKEFTARLRRLRERLEGLKGFRK